MAKTCLARQVYVEGLVIEADGCSGVAYEYFHVPAPSPRSTEKAGGGMVT